MWSLQNYWQVFAVVGLIGVILCWVPSVVLFVHVPGGEAFSGFYVLGPQHTASDYPFNVHANESYLVYLGVGNHMGSSVYYDIDVKLRNVSEPLPNATIGMCSPLPALYEYHAFVADGQTWEAPLNFSFSDVIFDGNLSLVNGIRVNGARVDVVKRAEWDLNLTGFYVQLFAELWIYNVTGSRFEFHNRFVGLWLNVTKAF